VYHLKEGVDGKSLKGPPSKRDIEPILFLSKTLSSAESRYWPTELEMAGLVWTVRKIAHMIKSSEHPTIIYTDHGATPAIAAATKLTTSSTDRLNMKLVRASMYLSQFRLDIRHRPGKSNVIPDALSRLPVEKDNSSHGALDLDQDLEHYQPNMKAPETDQIFAYATTLVEMSRDFRAKIQEGYQKEAKWTELRKMLEDLSERIKDDHGKSGIDFLLEDDLLFHIKDRKRLCIPSNCEIDVFQLAHDQNNHSGHNRAAIYQALPNLRAEPD
jgi:hypothetical protein